MVGKGIFSSKLSNLIQVWGGTHDYLIRALQVTQNKAMRLITGLSWYTPTGVLLRKCNWMSVKQLIVYHSILTVHRTVANKCPAYIHQKIHTETHHNTRHTVKYGENFKGKTERTQSSL